MDGVINAGRAPRPERWAVTWRPAPRAAMRLFCLPHAGGGAATFRRWAQLLAPDIEVVAIRLPGRESRLAERPCQRIDQLVPALVRDLEPWLYKRHAWFGHSMGAGVAFEVCRLMRRLDLPPAERLIVAAAPAPQLPRREPPVHDAPVGDLLGRLRELNGTSAEVLDELPMLMPLIPMLRADFALAENHAYRPEHPLRLPISVYGGTADESVNDEELAAWRHQSSLDTSVRLFDGGHFFVHDADGAVPHAVATDLLEAGRSDHNENNGGLHVSYQC
ncbi:thioesterase II family protein [Micromonospora sp. CA-240977]|uniref:thioesterase II family protein n=1 Tax=Micromonospora sp. CA-240977 TaxID=3239957 RepID=UPI003D936FB4